MTASRPDGADDRSATVVDVHDAFCLHPLPDGAVVALRGLSLRVPAGERLVVHGPNGSGKTTLLRLLAGEQRLAAGRAVVAGFDVGTAAPRAVARWRRSQLGWVDQRAARTLRPELDVLANVALQLRLGGVDGPTARRRAGDWLDRLDLGHLGARRPGGLSGGEAQRVAVVAALAHEPTLVLADEPSGELDLDAADVVYDSLARAVSAAGATLVLVSHDRRAGRVADRVVRIRDGRLSETWTPDDPQERLVVDDRGWVRLPDALRGRGPAGPVRARRAGDEVVLADVGPTQPANEVAAERGHAVGSSAIGDGPVVVARLRGVAKAYGGRTVVDELDLDIVGGRLHVLSGRSGSGKSTVLRLLSGLARPDRGTVSIDGIDLGGLDRAGLAGLRRRFAAVVAQDVHLAETIDVAANVELARAARGLPADATGEARWLSLLGLSALSERAARVLSGGERQRTAVARALSTGARLVVLDEPSSQLDEGAVEQLVRALCAAADGGVAVVLATHDPALVAAADTVTELGAP